MRHQDEVNLFDAHIKLTLTLPEFHLPQLNSKPYHHLINIPNGKMTRLEYRCYVKKKGPGVRYDSIAVDRVLPDSKDPQGLAISFHRTIRVPDNAQVSQLPPSLGSFPLYKIHDYASRLPKDMVDKGGVFFPMYQKEAMWIKFESDAPFMIKIYCGGVNAISGEHSNEDADTKQRNSELIREGESMQDYIVVPSQPWLDGVAVKPSVVQQFVAMPMGHGYSVEAQLTGKEVVGGIQFEVTPALRTLHLAFATPAWCH